MSLARYLFSSTEHAIVTQRWHACLSKEACRFEHCAVKSVVHVKSISSFLAHEYLHAAIENTITGARTRIIMERNILDDLVVLGRWGSTPHSLTLQDSIRINPQHPLPVLPLRSLEFTANDFKVIDLAKILEDTTAIGCYTLLRRNCYWFASVVYKSIKDQFPCVETQRRYCSWRYLPTPYLKFRRGNIKDAAQNFEEEIKNTWYTR